MENAFESSLYYIQQESPADTHPAILRLSKRSGSTWVGHYWDRRAQAWHESEDIVRRYWNGFDADVEKVSEQTALDRIQGLPRLAAI